MRALRPLLILLTIVTVLAATVTTAGRVLVNALPRFEARLNSLLVGSGVALTGIDGAWHGLNPLLRADEVSFPGGRARGITMEVDLLESAIRSALVMHYLAAERVELTPARGTDGAWHLGAGGGESQALSIEALLRHSDALELPDVRVQFVERTGTPNTVGELHLRAALANTLLRHAGALTMRVVHGGSGEVTLAYDVTQGLLESPSRGRVALRSSSLSIAPAFGIALGGGGGIVDELNGDWTFGQGDSAGSLALAVRDLTLPTGELSSVAVRARGSMERFGLRWAFVFDQLEARGAPDVAVQLGDTRLVLNRNLEGASDLEFTLPAFDVEPLNAIVIAAAGKLERVNEWSVGLQPRGRVTRLVGRLDLTGMKLDYVAEVADVELENFKGVPYVRHGNATVAGTEESVLIGVHGTAMTLGLFEFYDTPFRFDTLSGDVLLWFSPEYLGLAGSELEARIGGMHAHGEFAVARPRDPLEQRVFATLRMRDVEGRSAVAYVPQSLPLRAWLDGAVLDGQVDEFDLVYHGHMRTLPGVPMRQSELRVRLRDAQVRFHSDWPTAEAVAGEIVATAAGVRGEFDHGNVSGIHFSKASLRLPSARDRIEFDVVGGGNGGALRRLIDSSPLANWLAFVKPQWKFAGPFEFVAALQIPLSQARSPEVDLTMKLNGVDLVFAELNLPVNALRGDVHYRYPNEVDAERIDGILFDAPARFTALSEDGVVRLSFSGRAEARAVTDWRGLPAQAIAIGGADFAGEYRIQPGSARPARLRLTSDLMGLDLNLPAPLGKTADEMRPTTLEWVFDATADRLALQSGSALRGWLRVTPHGIGAGDFGIGVDSAAERGDEDAVSIAGNLGSLDLSDWLVPATEAGAVGFAWNVNALNVERVSYSNTGFTDLVVDARGRGNDVTISVAGPDIEGSATLQRDAPTQIDLHYLRMPPRVDARTGDPLANVDARAVGDLDVVVQSLMLGAQNYGKWQFRTRKSETGIAVEGLVADVKGLHIESAAGTSWAIIGGSSQTHFTGNVTATDLATVLPQWGYAGTLETTAMQMDADVGWAGSPFNFSLPIVDGRISLAATKGRFVDAGDGAGAVRIFSLLNFAAIAKRMTLDFSDVFGKGISFDKVTATGMADHGTIALIEPMVIEGTGGNFQINGTVNFMSGALDNEMLVTLPVSSSLPWYAAYLGFVNPLAAGAVLVGERIFRNQIEKFSSAKYQVTGTIADPKVTFVQVFPKALAGPDAQPAADAAPAAEPAAETPTDKDGDE